MCLWQLEKASDNVPREGVLLSIAQESLACREVRENKLVGSTGFQITVYRTRRPIHGHFSRSDSLRLRHDAIGFDTRRGHRSFNVVRLEVNTRILRERTNCHYGSSTHVHHPRVCCGHDGDSNTRRLRHQSHPPSRRARILLSLPHVLLLPVGLCSVRVQFAYYNLDHNGNKCLHFLVPSMYSNVFTPMFYTTVCTLFY